MHHAPTLIALVGPESTGKTTLAAQLARECDGLWVPEYTRSFCDIEQRMPLQAEQRIIMQRQMQHEAAAQFAAAQLHKRYVFCDATPLMTAIYSELVFKDMSLLNEAIANHRRYAITLFMQPDIGWQADGQRDGAYVQPVVTEMVERYLSESQLPFVKITGTGEARLQLALKFIYLSL